MNDIMEMEKLSSVSKALRIINCFDSQHPEWSLAQLGRCLNMPKTTILSLLHSLEKEGYVVRIPNTPNYSLGIKFLEIGYSVRQTLPVLQYSIPILQELQSKTGCNVYLTTHRDGQLLYLESMHSSQYMVKYSVAGKILPLHCTSSGKAIFSYMSDQQIRQIINRWGLKPCTPNTITSPEALFEEIERIRSQGYAIDNEEESLGVKCVAMCIHNRSGLPVGAISISGSAITLSDDILRGFTDQISQAVVTISQWADLLPARFLDQNIRKNSG